jgi:hypothetical protein
MEVAWANLGGALGMLLGVAFMSIFETLDLTMDYAQFAVFLTFCSEKINLGKNFQNRIT